MIAAKVANNQKPCLTFKKFFSNHQYINYDVYQLVFAILSEELSRCFTEYFQIILKQVSLPGWDLIKFIPSRLWSVVDILKFLLFV